MDQEHTPHGVNITGNTDNRRNFLKKLAAVGTGGLLTGLVGGAKIEQNQLTGSETVRRTKEMNLQAYYGTAVISDIHSALTHNQAVHSLVAPLEQMNRSNNVEGRDINNPWRFEVDQVKIDDTGDTPRSSFPALFYGLPQGDTRRDIFEQAYYRARKRIDQFNPQQQEPVRADVALFAAYSATRYMTGYAPDAISNNMNNFETTDYAHLQLRNGTDNPALVTNMRDQLRIIAHGFASPPSYSS